jgi:hypothetical protein
VLATLTIAAAQGSTCCGSGPPTDPGTLGPSEQAGLSVGLAGALEPSRWSSDGQLHATPPDAELAATLAGRVRLGSALQVGAALPALLRAQGSQLGLGQASVGARLEPPRYRTGAARPVLVAALVAPASPSAEDMPPWWRLAATPALERQGEGSSQVLWATLSAPLWAPGEPEVRPGVDWELGASAGPRGEWGSCALGLGARGTTQGQISGQAAGRGSFAPLLRLAGALPLREEMRLVATATGTPPLPAVGRNAILQLSAGAALMRIW